MKKVVIVKSFERTFRIPFYKELIPRLKQQNIKLQVLFGQPNKFLADDKDIVKHLPFGQQIQNRHFYFRKRIADWQPALRYLRGADLVIVQQGNAHILNHVLLFLRRIYGFKLAFWGHGKNFQSENPNGLLEQFKRFYSRNADYWFAYTEESKKILIDIGVPEYKITSVDNAIDTTKSIKLYEEITSMEIRELQTKYNIQEHSPVGLFCSRLYPEKRVDFLIDTVKRLKEQIKDFHFFVIGDGVNAPIIRSFYEKNNTWFHWVGSRYEKEKVCFFKLAQFQLMPGLVGLHIVDSFALLTPLITTKNGLHGPEIIYLENEINGIMTENSLDAYVRAIVGLINDKAYHERLLEGCRRAREKYTIENMASRFAEGVCKVLMEN